MNNPQLVQPVPDEHLHGIVRKALGPRAVLHESRLLKGGQFNTAYYLETREPDHRLVLRIAPSDDRPLFRYERGMMLAEPWIYSCLEQAGVPAPRTVALDTTRTVLDRIYILQGYVDALPLNHADVPAEVRPRLMREAGQCTARIHAIRGERFGWPKGDGSVRGSGSWTFVFGDLLAETCEEGARAEVISTAEEREVMRRYEESRSAFDACREPVLVHNDIWAPNILVGKDPEGRWSVRAIIDADRAVFADREFEYILWDRDTHWEEFMEGYGTPLSDTEDAAVRRRFYRFYWYLFAAWCYTKQIWRPDARDYSLRVAMETLQEIRKTAG